MHHLTVEGCTRRVADDGTGPRQREQKPEEPGRIDQATQHFRSIARNSLPFDSLRVVDEGAVARFERYVTLE